MLKRCSKLNPETRQALMVRAAVHSADGKLNDAIADVTIAIRLDPSYANAWSFRSRFFLDRKNFRQAIDDATHAINMGFNRPEAMLNRATAHAFLGEYEKALADYATLERLAPNDALFSNNVRPCTPRWAKKEAAADWQARRNSIRRTRSRSDG